MTTEKLIELVVPVNIATSARAMAMPTQVVTVAISGNGQVTRNDCYYIQTR